MARLKKPTLSKSEKRAPLAKLEALLTKSSAELAALRKEYIQVNADIKNERNFDIQVALDEARQAIQLQSIESTNPQINEADRLLQRVTLYFLQSKVENLEQRLLSRYPRLALWESQQKLLTKQIANLETRLGLIRTLVTNNRQSEANQITASAEERLETLKDEPKVLLNLAQKNIALAKELNKLVSDQDKVIDEKEKATLGAQRIQQKYTSLTDQLAIAQLGTSPEFGAALRKQRDQLTDESKALRSLSIQNQELTKSRLAQFRIDALRERDRNAELAQIFAELAQESSASVTDEQKQIVQNLLAAREMILEKLSTAYWNYISNLTSLTVQSDSLFELSKQYAELLDRQLLWMPSSPLLDVDSISALHDSVLWLVEPKEWQKLTHSVLLKTQKYGILIGFVVLASLLLIQRSSQLIKSLSGMKGRVGKVNRDKLRLTLLALIITILLALPGPLLLLSASFLFNSDTLYSAALGDTIKYGTIIYFILNFVLQSARKNGLLSLHLKWSGKTVTALRKNLPWFIAMIIPALMLSVLIEESAPGEIRSSLGRIIFIFEIIALAFFIRHTFSPARAALWNDREKKSLNISEWLYRHARFTLIVIIPTLLVGLSVYGYHYSAVQLADHLLNSALVILAGNLSFGISLRAFAIKERQLALEKLRAKRAAALAAKKLSEEDIDEGDDNAPTAIDLQEIDLKTISKQTQTLLKLVFTVAVGIALWQVWSEIFPAFKPLVNVQLWQVQEMIDGIQTNVAITLWDLLLAIATLVITYLATRNISGLLDVALLSRVSLKPGSSYAIATVAQYAIVIIGSVIALQGLGAQWSKLQWLIAALSVGLGFGLQEIVANFVSGIVILFERPYRIGDTVTVGNQWGTVTKIQMRATTIIDWDRREIIVPNKTFIMERLTNWTLTDAITRRKINVGVAYGSDVELVERLLLGIASENNKVLDEPAPEAFFVSFGESCLDFCLRIFVKGHREHAAVAHEIHKSIDRVFKENGIVIAFPQRDLHLDSKPLEIQLIDKKTTEKGPNSKK